MELGLAEKVVAITGGATGIGLSCALAFAAEGCKVAICGRRQEKIIEASQRFSAMGYDLFTMVADVSLENEIYSFADQTYKKFGKIDIWLNNAGVAPKSLLMDMSGEDWDEVMRINLKSVFLGSKIAAKFMKIYGEGVILNASSFASIIPSACGGAYAASKAAVTNLTKSFAAELAPHGIRVNAYIPGMIVTDMSKNRIEQSGSKLTNQIAMNRLGRIEEVAAAIVFLASDAAGYITGTTLEVSGGKFTVQNSEVLWG